MVPRADANPFHVEDRGDVVRMGVVDRERQDPGLFLHILRTVRLHSFEPFELLERVLGDLHFVGADRIHAEFREIVDRDSEADGARDVGRPAFEAVRHVVPRGPAEMDLPNHLASPEEGLRRLEGFRFAV